MARNALSYYEAAKPSRLRKFHHGTTGPNVQTQQGAVAIRTQARYLAQNHDIARGALRVTVNNVVGPKGIGIEPQPRRMDGSIHREYADALLAAYKDWTRKPEVTRRHNWASVQRLMARSWIRDGEAFAQQLFGSVPFLSHGGQIPFSLELIEADMVPFDYSDPGRGILQGVERNQWGQAKAYWKYKNNPNDNHLIALATDLKRIPAERVLHLALIDRIDQVRGVSEFASVITRLEDIKDYEESERVAAKIAAMLTAYVKRGTPELYDPSLLPQDENGNPVAQEMGSSPLSWGTARTSPNPFLS
jgi:lambda family phage portal protein